MATTTSGSCLPAYRQRGELSTSTLLEIYAPRAVARSFRDVKTVSQALGLRKSGAVLSLGTLAKDNGAAKVETILKMQLVELNDLLGLKTSMTKAQVEAMASDILDLYPHLTIADVNIVLGRIRRGECGKLYDRLTMPQLMQIFSDYNDERCEEAARQSRAEAESCRWEHEREDKDRQTWHNALKASLMSAAKAQEAETGIKANSDGK